MISFLGTGLLGGNFTRALLNRGEKVQVWNRSADKAKALESAGAVAFDNPALAVKGALRVHVAVSDDAAVDEVLGHASRGFEKQTIIVDHTTTSAEGAVKRSLQWKREGHFYIHAPVFMGPANALQGTGTMLVSGDQQVIKQIEPALSAMTGRLWNLGPDPARAAAIKLLGNLIHISLTGGIADMLTLADSLGVPPDELGPLLELINPTVVSQLRLKKISSNTFNEASWELNMARKDARLMMEKAASANTKLFVIPAVAQKMDIFLDKGHAKDDWTIIGKV